MKDAGKDNLCEGEERDNCKDIHKIQQNFE
jgi:hypothetical protein